MTFDRVIQEIYVDILRNSCQKMPFFKNLTQNGEYLKNWAIGDWRRDAFCKIIYP